MQHIGESPTQRERVFHHTVCIHHDVIKNCHVTKNSLRVANGTANPLPIPDENDVFHAKRKERFTFEIDSESAIVVSTLER